jgi:glycosyltransferase involved in cell wall biosynthesis
MRTGANPAKAGIPAYTPQELGVALIVYIPFTEGYFANSLEILNYQIASLRATTRQPFDLLVFDNGSCLQAVTELNKLYKEEVIDWLVLSQHNLGKAGAWNWIFATMPNEWICYADSDVLFRENWFEASREVFDAFPLAGMVAAQPNFFDVMKGEGKAHLPFQNDGGYVFGDYRPDKAIVDEYCTGIGASDELAAQFYENPLPAITNRSTGTQAVIGASHMQFLTKRSIARQVVPLQASKGLLRSETMGIDYKIDELGYLHLSTLKPYVFHMGNTLNERLIKEVREITGASKPPESATTQKTQDQGQKHKWLVRLAKNPRINDLFLRVYNLLFRVLYVENEGK